MSEELKFTACMIGVMVLILAGLYGMLTAISKGDAQREQVSIAANKGLVRSGDFFRDLETGCEYIQLSTGVTPRLNRDGKVFCHD